MVVWASFRGELSTLLTEMWWNFFVYSQSSSKLVLFCKITSSPLNFNQKKISGKTVVTCPLKEGQTSTFLKFETFMLAELHVLHAEILGKLLHISTKRVVNSPLKEGQNNHFFEVWNLHVTRIACCTCQNFGSTVPQFGWKDSQRLVGKSSNKHY